MKSGGNGGFTLLELILVVLVISLALGVSIPSLSRGTASVQLKTSARDVLNTMRYARERAITEQMVFLVAADAESGRLLLTDEVGDGGRNYELPKEVRIEGFSLGGEQVREGPLVLRFLPNGSTAAAEILLRSRTGAALRVVTDPMTGGARILQGEGEFRR